MSKDTWEKGVKEGCFKNPGSRKRKKVGKPVPRPRGIRKGVRKMRTERRRAA